MNEEIGEEYIQLKYRFGFDWQSGTLGIIGLNSTLARFCKINEDADVRFKSFMIESISTISIYFCNIHHNKLVLTVLTYFPYEA
jgi:hypothetical protein